jgi:hypothetical protein
MPPFLGSSLMKWTLAAMGGVMVVHWVVREVRRVNDELNSARARVLDDERRQTLRRDPSTGEYRIEG